MDVGGAVSALRVVPVTIGEARARYVEGDRYPLEVPAAKAAAEHGRSRVGAVVAVSAPPGATSC